MAEQDGRAPDVPRDLDDAGKRLYRFLRKAMRDRDTGPTRWENADHHLLAQACRYDHRARRARDAFKTSPDEMVTLGDRKQLTVHPFVKIAEQSERQFIDCLKELGFSPRARKALDIEQRAAGPSKFGLG